jgi:hypothetical protein
VDLILRMLQRHPQCSKTIFLYRPPLQHNPRNTQRSNPAKHCLPISTRIDQGGEQHVARNPGKTIEIGCFHGFFGIARRFEKAKMPDSIGGIC